VRDALPDGAATSPVGVWPPVVAVRDSVLLDVSYADSQADLQAFLRRLADRVAAVADSVVVDTFGSAYPPINYPGTDFFATAVVMSLRLSDAARAATAERPVYSRADVVPQALDAVAQRALDWVGLPTGRRFARLGMVSVQVSQEEQAALLQTGLRNDDTSLDITTADWPRAARRVNFTPYGQVIFLFGSGEGYDPAATAIEQAVALMQANAEWVDYAFVVRSTRALLSPDTLLQWCWPRLPEINYDFRWYRRLEGLRTYDAFGVQMLPTATVDALGTEPEGFTRRPAGEDATLLIHADAERWFATGNPTAEDLAPAREALRPILMTQGDHLQERPRFLP
jgi:hypothetical protein